MKDTLFSELAALCEALEKTKRRKEIAGMTGNFLKGLSRNEIPRAVNLISGRAAYKSLNMNVATVLEIVNEIVKRRPFD